MIFAFSHLLNFGHLWQKIEDTVMRNIVRSVASDTLFEGKELEELYILFKVKLMAVKALFFHCIIFCWQFSKLLCTV